MKDNAHRTRDGGTEDGKQRSKGQEQWNRATEKGTLGQLIGVRGRRQGTNHVRQGIPCLPVYRGGESRSRAMRQGTEEGRQGAEP